MAKRKREIRDFELRFYEGVIERTPNYIEALVPLAEAYTRLGLFKKGLEIDLKLSRLCKEDPIAHYNLACSFSLTGQPKKALQSLNKAIRLGYSDFRYMRRDPDLKPLHGDPGFKKILQLTMQKDS